jgi:glutathione S-transferase
MPTHSPDLFNDSVLFVSARSPFARRVRLAFREHGIRHEEKVVDVFKPNPDLIALNPLARVPTVRLSDGSVLAESEKILGLFYESRPNSPLLAPSGPARVTAHFWSALALGLCEKSVEFYLESLRVESARDPELLEEVREIATRVLERFDAFIGERETIVPGQLTQADLDMGAALGYLSLRYSDQWKSRYDHAADFLRRLEGRPSFEATRPPAPA